MKTLIVSGGVIQDDFIQKYSARQKFDYSIAVDSGMAYFYRVGVRPDCLIGDFDSAQEDMLRYFRGMDIPVSEYKPEKDETDTELAIMHAMEQGCTELHILGGTGNRLDHLLGTIRTLGLAMQRGVLCYLVDDKNRIRLIQERTVLKRTEQYGHYVSLIPLTTEVRGVTLTGLKYPLDNATMGGFHGGLGVSNQIVDDEAVIDIKSGVAVLVESKDQ